MVLWEVREIMPRQSVFDMKVSDLDVTYADFFNNAPSYNPRAELITGTVCGIRVETIEDPLMKRIRQLNKLVEELANGKLMENILR